MSSSPRAVNVDVRTIFDLDSDAQCLRAEVVLACRCDTPEDLDEDAAPFLERLLADAAPEGGDQDMPDAPRVGDEVPGSPGRRRAAVMQVVLRRSSIVSEVDEMRDCLSHHLLAFDEASPEAMDTADMLIHCPRNLLDHVMAASDDRIITTVGVVEHIDWHPWLSGRDVLAGLVSGLSMVTASLNGLLLGAYLPRDARSGHARLDLEAACAALETDRPDEGVRVGAWCLADGSGLGVACGLMRNEEVFDLQIPWAKPAA